MSRDWIMVAWELHSLVVRQCVHLQKGQKKSVIPLSMFWECEAEGWNMKLRRCGWLLQLMCALEREVGLHLRAFTYSNHRLMFEEYKLFFCSLRSKESSSQSEIERLWVNQVSVRRTLTSWHTPVERCYFLLFIWLKTVGRLLPG